MSKIKTQIQLQLLKGNVKTIAVKNDEYILTLGLPEGMKNHNLDIFFIYIDPNTEAVDMNLETRKVNDQLELKMNSQKNKKKFMVIIEPINSLCLYIEVSKVIKRPKALTFLPKPRIIHYEKNDSCGSCRVFTFHL